MTKAKNFRLNVSDRQALTLLANTLRRMGERETAPILPERVTEAAAVRYAIHTAASLLVVGKGLPGAGVAQCEGEPGVYHTGGIFAAGIGSHLPLTNEEAYARYLASQQNPGFTED